MSKFIFNKNKMEFRYSSGITMYSERLQDGRLLSVNYNCAGMPMHERDCVNDIPVCAFDLVIDGHNATYGWEFVNWTTYEAEERSSAELIIINKKLNIQMRIKTFCGDNGFFSRHVYLKNLSDKKLSVTRISPLTGTLWELNRDVKDSLQDYSITPFKIGTFKDNHWGAEGNFDWCEVPYNAGIEFGGENGCSGHGHPFAIVHNSVVGGYFVCQMEWGANWKFSFRNDFRITPQSGNPELKPYLRLKFSLSPEAMAPMRVINVDEEIEAPRIHFGYGYNGFDETICALHSYQRKYLLAKPVGGYDLIGYDHWGYMEHEMDEEKLLVEVERAAELGAEVFVVDAGWYGKAFNHWYESVGDWQYCRLENDLYPVIRRAKELNLKFGLWIEPEAVGPASELRKTHPEWLMQRYGKGIERCLDLARPEVEKYVENQIVNVIERYDLDMLRLDYNNQYLCEGGFNEDGEYSENTHWRHVEAIHRIFDNIRKRFPNLWLENCASGGGRTDLGMMTRFSKTQFSDWYKFPLVARTFNGMSLCLPPECLMFLYGSVQSASCYGNAETQLQMSVQGIPQLSGVAYYEEEINPELKMLIKKYVKLYKEYIRPIQNKVKLYHHTPVVGGFSGKGWVVSEAMLPDGSKGYVNINRLPGCKEDIWNLKLRGCDCAKRYAVTDVADERKYLMSGYELYANGLPVVLEGALTSRMFLIEAIN